MGITAKRINRITEQAAAMKAIGKASVDVSDELDALVSENELMEAEIQSLEEANARLRERLNRGENHDAYMKLPLDAYGEPIRMGDVVNVDGDAMTVLGYRRDDTLLLIAKDRKSGLFFSPEPSRVRHFKLEPPDSWEKLEKDAMGSEELGDMEQGEWCLAEQEAELVEDAKKLLLEEMDDAIKRLKDKEAEEAADD